MAAHVEEPAQLAVVAPDDEDRLVRELPREVLAGLADLVGAAGELPGARERRAQLEVENARIDVPRRRDRPGFCERVIRVVEVDDLVDGRFHGPPIYTRMAP